VLVLLSLPRFNEALKDVFGDDAPHARLRDVSAFADPRLTTLLEQLKEETGRPAASALLVRGLAQALAVHVAREYTRCVAPASPRIHQERDHDRERGGLFQPEPLRAAFSKGNGTIAHGLPASALSRRLNVASLDPRARITATGRSRWRGPRR
jgi:hypothetical protein